MVAMTLLLVPLLATPGRALFHLAEIHEVMSGAGGDASVQYVEIRMLAGSQNFVKDTRLTFFSCMPGNPASVLLLVPANVSAQGADVRWIMATGSFAAAAGITPDFTFTAGVDPACGMVCWGAPGIVPPNPATWDHTDPNNYTSCIAYGSYTGPTPVIAITTGLPAGDGTQSLTRSGASAALATPTPTNNAGNQGCVGGGCPTTTTTTTLGGTTTTTLAGPQLLSGKKLLLKADGLVLLSKDPAISLGSGNGSTDDPTVSGATLRVQLDTYDLPSENWKVLGGAGNNLGYKYSDPALAAGPIKTALIKAGKLVKAVGKGGALGHDLGSNPDPVGAVLAVGGQRYCTSFGGTVSFTAGKKFLAKDAPAPGACP
jgi:hypothetical protein